MAYQSPENAQKLRDIPQVANYTATNNAPPMSQEVVQSLAGATPNTNLSPAEGGNNVPQASSASAQADKGMNWGAIGEALRGFGAGYEGRGNEFVAGLDKRRESLDKSRQQAMLKDLTTVNGLLSKGLYMEAEKLAVDRVGAIEKFGGDTSHTRQLLDLLRNGEYDKAQAIVGNEMESAYTMGLIDRPEKPAAVKTIKIFNEATGKNEIRVMESNGQLGGFVGQAPVTKPTSIVNVGAGEKSEQKEMGKRLATDFYETQNKGEVGRDMLFSLDKLAAMDDLDTDALAPLRLSVGQLANAVNIPDETIEKYLNIDISQGQIFIAETASMVLKIMATQKGPQTNEDRIQIQKTIADLGNTPQANRFINNSARAIARRNVDRAEFEQEHYDTTGSAKGATKAWRKSLGGAPMISKYQKSSTGLPLFYHDFVDAVKNEPQNIDVSNKDILAAWKEQEEKAKKDMTKPGGK